MRLGMSHIINITSHKEQRLFTLYQPMNSKYKKYLHLKLSEIYRTLEEEIAILKGNCTGNIVI